MRTKSFTLTPTTNEQIETITVTTGGLTYYPKSIIIENGTSGSVQIKMISTSDAEELIDLPSLYEYITLTTGDRLQISEVHKFDYLYYKSVGSVTGTINVSGILYQPVYSA